MVCVYIEVVCVQQGVSLLSAVVCCTLLCTSTALLAAVAVRQSCNKLLSAPAVLLLNAWGIMTVQLLTGVGMGLAAGDLDGLCSSVVCAIWVVAGHRALLAAAHRTRLCPAFR
jgi:hypothetical protein